MNELATIDVGQELAVQPRAVVQLDNDQLKFISNTEFVPKGLRGNLPAIMACVVTGRGLGIDDMAALRLINVIDGRPSFAAELMVMLVRRRGHSITGDVGAGQAIAHGKRRDTGDEMTATWTLAMAERAGLAGKQNWQKYPEAMLWARAVSQLCRMLFADVFVGGTYTPDELGHDADYADEELREDYKEALAEPVRTDNRKATQKDHKRLYAVIGELAEKHPDKDWEQLSKDLAKSMFGRDSRADLTVTEMADLIRELPAADAPF